MLNGKRDNLIRERRNYPSKNVVAQGGGVGFWIILDSNVGKTHFLQEIHDLGLLLGLSMPDVHALRVSQA